MASDWHKGPKHKKPERTRIDVRCSEKEKELIRKLAEKAGLDMSEYIREKLFGKRVVLRATDNDLVEV